MIYWRCQCGKAEMWESGMSPGDCQGCKECNTTFATGPNGHRPLQEHDWHIRYNPRTGAPDGAVCSRCHRRTHEPVSTTNSDWTRARRKLDL